MNGAFPIVPSPEGIEPNEVVELIASAVHMFVHLTGDICVNPYDPTVAATAGRLFAQAVAVYADAAQETLDDYAKAREAAAVDITAKVLNVTRTDHDHRDHPEHDHYRWSDDGGPHGD